MLDESHSSAASSVELASCGFVPAYRNGSEVKKNINIHVPICSACSLSFCPVHTFTILLLETGWLLSPQLFHMHVVSNQIPHTVGFSSQTHHTIPIFSLEAFFLSQSFSYDCYFFILWVEKSECEIVQYISFS